MAAPIFQRTIVDNQGNVVSGALVEVRNEATSALATIYNDRALTSVKANPFTTDSTGFAQFYVARGEYRVKATFSGTEIIWRYVQMIDTDIVTALSITENNFPVVSQTDIGSAPNQIPLNQFLGNVAYMSSNQLVVNPAASAAPAGIGDMVFQLTNNTTLVVKVMGSDGTVRSATLTLA
jgi:hypothetical protein